MIAGNNENPAMSIRRTDKKTLGNVYKLGGVAICGTPSAQTFRFANRAKNDKMTTTKGETMNKEYRDAIASLRKELGVKRLDPRSLVQVDDGAMCWITTRERLRAAPLWARQCLAKSDREGRRPDRYSYPETRDEDDNGKHNPKGYTAACSHVACLSACGDYPSHELPEEFMENVPTVGDLY